MEFARKLFNEQYTIEQLEAMLEMLEEMLNVVGVFEGQYVTSTLRIVNRQKNRQTLLRDVEQNQDIRVLRITYASIAAI